MGKRGHEISVRLKNLIISLYLTSRKSVLQISLECGVSRTTAYKHIQAFKQRRSLLRKHGQGRKPELSNVACKRALQLLTGDHLSTRACAQQLFVEHLTTHVVCGHTVKACVTKYAKDQGTPITCKAIRLRKRLSMWNKHQRLTFCRMHRSDTFKNVMFTDRCKFLFEHPGEAVMPGMWRFVNQPLEVSSSTHPQAFNVYGGITPAGTTKLHAVTGTTGYHPAAKYTTKAGAPSRNITSDEYYDVLMKGLLPEGNRLFHGQAWVLQQDNDPTHKVASEQAVHDWNQSLNAKGIDGGRVTIMELWPPNSPDLSIIENCWAITKRRVLAMKCDTFVEFTHAVMKVFSNIDAKPLYKSIPSRIRECISAKGDRTCH